MAQTVKDPFRLPVAPLPPAGWLRYGEAGLLLGSCFAGEVGGRLARDGFAVHTNPYGTSFNPVTTLQSVGLTWDSVAGSLVERDGGYTSHLLHSDIWAETEEGLRALFEQKRAALQAALPTCPWVSVTLGTAWVYRRKADGLLCANLHKQPAVGFERSLLSVEEILEAWRSFAQTMRGFGVRQFVLTVSPVIHVRDGLADNSLSKSVLRLAADQIARMNPETVYFPALEIVRDELRDYRFYAEDMQHPSPQAADIVYERFLNYALAADDQAVRSRFRALAAFANHRPRLKTDTALYSEKIQELDALLVDAAARKAVRTLLQGNMPEGV